MKEFIDKLIERLEEKAYNHFDLKLSDAIEIVNQLTEEYKGKYVGIGAFEQVRCERDIAIEQLHELGYEFGQKIDKVSEIPTGWIPVSERLPEEPFGCLVTVMDCEPMTQTDFENVLFYHVGYDGETWNDIDGNVIPFEVIAWMPLPAPYTEGE